MRLAGRPPTATVWRGRASSRFALIRRAAHEAFELHQDPALLDPGFQRIQSPGRRTGDFAAIPAEDAVVAGTIVGLALWQIVHRASEVRADAAERQHRAVR